MGMVRDTWRAVLILVVGVLLLEAAGLRGRTPAAVAPPQVETRWVQPQPQPIVIHQPQPQPERPLRRVAAAVTEFGDSVIGVFR